MRNFKVSVKIFINIKICFFLSIVLIFGIPIENGNPVISHNYDRDNSQLGK